MQGLQVRNYKITNEKWKIFKPTNNNVSKFTSNKTHTCIAKNYKFQVTKLQVTK